MLMSIYTVPGFVGQNQFPKRRVLVMPPSKWGAKKVVNGMADLEIPWRLERRKVSS